LEQLGLCCQVEPSLHPAHRLRERMAGLGRAYPAYLMRHGWRPGPSSSGRPPLGSGTASRSTAGSRRRSGITDPRRSWPVW
jgi:hypothetical protein